MKKNTEGKDYQKGFAITGYLFMVLGVIAAIRHETTLFATWLPIGAAFVALSYTDRSKK
jgi:hypothetical protein